VKIWIIRKLEGMNQFGFIYVYIWKCHNETKISLFKNKEQEGKTGPVWELVPMVPVGERMI
jgi:hypothetical protein